MTVQDKEAMQQTPPGENQSIRAVAQEDVETAFDIPDLEQPELKSSLYLNRELSMLEFNARVLDEALDKRNPLLERLRFLAIFNSNLDDFFMIRVSGLHEQVKAGVSEMSLDGMSPGEEMAAIRGRVLPLLETQASFYRDTLLPTLAKHGVKIVAYNQLTDAQKSVAHDYFERMVFPVCTPLAVDPGHPFPHISNLSLNLGVELQDPDGRRRFARVKVPNVLPRLVPLPNAEPLKRSKGGHGSPPLQQSVVYVWLEEVLAANLGALFPQMHILGVYPFRVIRDADLEIQELDAEDLLEMIEESLSQRRFGSAVAMFVNPGMPDHLFNLLATNLELEGSDLYVVEGPLGLGDLIDLYKLDRLDLKDPPFIPRIPAALRSGDIFYSIQQGDILLHHPFDSFSPVIEFIRAAASDKNVLAIKQTLYRVGRHSPIVEALLEAAEAGKQVAVLVELKARFDEENNIEWARALEQAGVHVTYGLIGLKTHCKVALVVRKEGDSIQRYVHLGTGNYNPTTARQYTDMGLFTCHPAFGADVSELFNYLTGYSKQTVYRKLLIAPVTMRVGILALIEREIKKHKEQGDGRIIFKVNNLVDPPIINALYRASQEGVQVDLIVRSMCCLRPGVPGVSDNIKVIRIVGRFLEHSRIFYFRNGGNEEMLMGSADLMQRNLDRRVETLFPIQDEAIRKHVLHDVLEVYLHDNTKASILRSNGAYLRISPSANSRPLNAQSSLANQTVNEPKDGLAVALSSLPKKYRKHLNRHGRVNPHE